MQKETIMHNVKSKYKNPDKYIQTLKAEIERERRWANESNEFYEKERGKQAICWTEGVIK